VLQWIIDNKSWLFSGIAITVPLAIFGWLRFRNGNKVVQKQRSGKNSTNIQSSRDVNIGERKDHE